MDFNKERNLCIRRWRKRRSNSNLDFASSFSLASFFWTIFQNFFNFGKPFNSCSLLPYYFNILRIFLKIFTTKKRWKFTSGRQTQMGKDTSRWTWSLIKSTSKLLKQWLKKIRMLVCSLKLNPQLSSNVISISCLNKLGKFSGYFWNIYKPNKVKITWHY